MCSTLNRITSVKNAMQLLLALCIINSPQIPHHLRGRVIMIHTEAQTVETTSNAELVQYGLELFYSAKRRIVIADQGVSIDPHEACIF